MNGGAVSSAPLSIAGRDSFVAGLGAGLRSGDRLTYRFVARDRAASPNLAYSNPAFDTLRVGPDWLEDLENGFPAGWQHDLLRRRDPWDLSHQRAFTPGGTSWKAGASDTVPYPPHLDGALMTPFIYDIAPGTVFTFEHWWDLEDDAEEAFDGAIVEAQQGYDGAWQQVGFADYDHESHDRALTNAPVGVPAQVPCWGGRSNGWRAEVVNLDSYAPGPVRFRFHMSADDFVGREGWYVDHVRVLYPGGPTADLTPAAPRLRIGLPSPNPARARLLQPLELARAADVSWELFDLAGRRVATLWRGRRAVGPGVLSAALPGPASSGLYFVRVAIDGVPRSTSRLAIVR